MKRIRYLFSSATSLLVFGAISQPALGQTASPTPPNPPIGLSDAQTGNDIVVTGIRASLRDALQAKRAATNVVETISSKDIGVLPDTTIADELARLPGVTATRDRGNDSQAAVRGLGPRLVLGLVNGREVASSEPDRNVRWEMFPSEDVAGVTLYKSQSADLISGGVAGTIDIHTLRPLDYSGPSLTIRGGALYNDGGKRIPGYSGWGTRESGQFVTHLTDTLGVVLGGNYQRQKNGFVSFQGWGYNTPETGSPPIDSNGQAINTPWGAQTEVKGLTQTRWSANGALQWKPDAHWDVDADVLYSDVKIFENQYQQWYGRSNGWGDWGGTFGGPGDIYQSGNYTLAGNDVVAATLNNYSSVTNSIGRYTEDKNLLATGVNATYEDDDWKASFDGSYSRAVRDNLWRSVFTESYPQTTTFSTGANVSPSLSVSEDPAATDSQTIQSYYGLAATGPQRLVDTIGAARADFTRKIHGGFFTAASIGLRYSNRVKKFSTDLAPANTIAASVALPASMLTEASVNGGGIDVPNLLFGNYDDIVDYAGITFPDLAPDPSQYWHVREDTFSGYVKGSFASDIGSVPFSGDVGVRLVSVSTHSDAFGQVNGAGYDPVHANKTYFRALPSLNVNFDLTSDLKLRLGVARVMSRPPLDELRASRNLTQNSPTQGTLNSGTAGNPYLKPFMATQGDLSLEWYFHKDALIALAGYYKDVGSNIGYATQQQTIEGVPYQITGPFNGKGGHIEGAEITVQTPFWFLGLDHFGIYSNAAFVHSNLKELAPVSHPFTAVGMADFTGELDLWYSDHGIDARVALKHHSPFTVIYGWDASQLTRLESETNLGASISYALNKHITLRAQANNLTNQVARFYFNNDPNQLARYERYGRNYLFDITVKY